MGCPHRELESCLARKIGEELLQLGEGAQDAGLLMTGHSSLAITAFWRGGRRRPPGPLRARTRRRWSVALRSRARPSLRARGPRQPRRRGKSRPDPRCPRGGRRAGSATIPPSSAGRSFTASRRSTRPPPRPGTAPAVLAAAGGGVTVDVAVHANVPGAVIVAVRAQVCPCSDDPVAAVVSGLVSLEGVAIPQRVHRSAAIDGREVPDQEIVPALDLDAVA